MFTKFWSPEFRKYVTLHNKRKFAEVQNQDGVERP